MRIRAAVRAIAIAATAAAALVVPSEGASAAPAPAAPSRLQQAPATVAGSTAPVVLRKTGTTTGVAAAVTGPPVITCNAVSDYPHKSTHVPGTVNVIGRGVCDYPVGAIDVVTGLFRGYTVVGTGSRYQTNVASLSASAATPCVSGSYIGVADVIFYAPPGYSPAYLHLVNQSIPISITC